MNKKWLPFRIYIHVGKIGIDHQLRFKPPNGGLCRTWIWASISIDKRIHDDYMYVIFNSTEANVKLYRHTNFSAISRISLKYLITGLNFSWMSHKKKMAFSGFIFPSLSDCEAIFNTTAHARMQTLWHHKNASIA